MNFPNSTESILRRQRLLSGMPPKFRIAPGRPPQGKAAAKELARFLNPPLIGRPPRAVVVDRGQFKFAFYE